jgi:hypothetical protein
MREMGTVLFMIISEKQIMQLMEYVRFISFDPTNSEDMRNMTSDLIKEILNQQSEELRTIE